MIRNKSWQISKV